MEGKIIELKNIGVLNPNKEDLTIDKLRTFNGLKNLNDKEAQETIFVIQTLTNVLYDFTNEQCTKSQQLKRAA